MLKNKIFLLTIIFSLGLVVSGCSLSFKTGDTKKAGPDGGIFVSLNKGETWSQVVLVPSIKGAPGNIGNTDASSLVVDPSDSNTLYFGTTGRFFYTYDIAKGWNQVEELPREEARAIAVNPDNKCMVYVALANKVYRTDDCSRTWTQVYFDNDPKTAINSIMIDYYDSNKLYIGTSRGEVIKSLDKGKSWQTILRAESDILKIVLSPHDSRMIFVGTEKKSLFRSIDGGSSWLSLKDNMKDYKNSYKIRDMALAADEERLIFVATTYGLLKSPDNGNTWSRIELITPEKESTINAMAISPKDSKEIYYVTNTTFYSSFDGGESWVTRKLPSSRAGWRLVVNPKEENIIYLGVRLIEKRY